MSTRFTGIAFGAGPVGYQGDKEEKIREVVEKINKETEAAGLPWWAGMFNPEIVKLANIEQGQCNCAKEEPESAKCGETDRKPEETPEERKIRELGEQRERLRRADELVITAIRLEIFGMEKLEALLDREDTKSAMAIEYARTIAEAGNAVARLRGGMAGMPVYGYGV